MTELTKKVAARVHTLRVEQGLSLEQLSAASGLRAESINRLERGRTVPGLDTLEKLAKGLGVSVARLVAVEGKGELEADGLPAGARGVAVMLVGQPDEVVERARKIVRALVEG